MPYIARQRREGYQEIVDAFSRARIDTSGELNYTLTMACEQYLRQHGGPNYRILDEIIGALECAKLEYYRRRVSPLEELKRSENGDVFD